MIKLTKQEVDEMFAKLAHGQLESSEWINWWNLHVDEIKSLISPGDFVRIKFSNRPNPNPYETMLNSQEDVIRYFGKRGIEITADDTYEKKRVCFQQDRLAEATKEYEQRIEPFRQRWEEYRCQHNPYTPPSFDVNKVIGLSNEDPNRLYDQQGYVQNDLCKAFIKEQFKLKLVPLTKAYGMKWKQPYTFIRERNGVVIEIKFNGYFRGGGIESMSTSIMPAYMLLDLPTDYCELPENCKHTQYSEEVFDYNNWRHIHYVKSATLLCEQIDRIVQYLAKVVLPMFDEIDSVETFFAKERLDWYDLMKVGPPMIKFQRGWINPAWNTTSSDTDSSAVPYVEPKYSYMFGIWNLYSGQENTGYEQLADCTAKLDENAVAYKWSFPEKESLTTTDLRNYAREIMRQFAWRFLKTRDIDNPGKRREQIISTYQDVCKILKNAYKY
ncbi:hypothetical protein [Anaerosporobacter sp.]|uniref:hypothetical protein n=1 Tax=Anaerosporobacter sp. TaxID=1872529 RepID=UPI00286EEEAA|nr:hypothetical protein [Anaerosporobacter sp.]